MRGVTRSEGLGIGGGCGTFPGGIERADAGIDYVIGGESGKGGHQPLEQLDVESWGRNAKCELGRARREVDAHIQIIPSGAESPWSPLAEEACLAKISQQIVKLLRREYAPVAFVAREPQTIWRPDKGQTITPDFKGTDGNRQVSPSSAGIMETSKSAEITTLRASAT
jgi:hypothetical protein